MFRERGKGEVLLKTQLRPKSSFQYRMKGHDRSKFVSFPIHSITSEALMKPIVKSSYDRSEGKSEVGINDKILFTARRQNKKRT